jgi:16S rRNA (cytidine1402-2'-O)-methyltransferase
MLILVATPIGNLGDISFRAIEALKSADLILCEDTRHSQKLLHHYQIKKPLQSYHKFNEQKKTSELLKQLKEGKTICLISDGGTPLISDPGHSIVQACIREEIPLTAIPGACALIQALICSGMQQERFQFIGFLPKKEKELSRTFEELIAYPGVSICYEAPHRILETLMLLEKIAPEAPVCLARELTKKFETFLRGTASQIASELQNNPPKGEYVLLIHGKKIEADYSSISIEDHVEQIQKTHQISKRDAIKIVADLRGQNKSALYRSLHNPL